MGNNETSKGIAETVAEEAKIVAAEVYKDAAKPALVAAGSTLGRLVRLALRPIEMLAQGGERLMSAVERKLVGVPESRLLSAPATIAAPAALHYALLGDSDEASQLREMFENLLVSSMDSDTAMNAHPAFVSMISQLTPDEAWILKSITETLRVPIIEVRHQMEGTTKWVSGGFVCDLGRGIGIDESYVAQSRSLSNLERLGILDISFDSVINDEKGQIYATLIERMHRESKPLPGTILKEHKGIMTFSAIGYLLWECCVRGRRA